ncbi:MAG: 3-methyl-2-oxobutanoate hydroxymethyltransferase [Elusimicrobiota bacterium]|jgi:3-methyl-2-oxobutanoate hydroxymethyltransferase|nr:3-methyl-2-oxobutanoate hydroxymethyltransferase [Elusimicrobiota bacterium]
MKHTIQTLKQQKAKQEKIAMLTAYDYTTAKLMDEAGIEAILVGDSLGMVMLGYEDTLPVTVEDIIHHTKAVARGVKNALIVADMPFMAYQSSVRLALKNAGRLIKEGRANAVKLEGARAILPQVKALVAVGIPVMGHLGLTPQSVNIFGGYKVQARQEDAAAALIVAAKALEKAGAFAIVLECIPTEVAAKITAAVKIPTIGIGAGKECDGQVLVYQDMLGLYDGVKPKFVKQFLDGGVLFKKAFKEYIKETKKGVFPSSEHCFKMQNKSTKQKGQG